MDDVLATHRPISTVYLLCGLLMWLPAPSIASPELGRLLELDLEQLLTIKVVSKRDENISQAPGIVSVITESDIRRFGYRNLRDILNRQTSLQIVGSNLFPHNKATIRGVTTSHVDNNVLIQLNGRPIREPVVSSMNHDLYDFFPVALIKKIEIIRGPGSVLYGTNAFSGVINIITREAISETELQLAVTGGSFDTQKLDVSGGVNQGGFNVYGGIRSSRTKGGDFDPVTDELGTQGRFEAGHEGEQALVRMSHNNLTLTALYSDTETDNARSVFALPSTTHQYRRSYLDLGYQTDITTHWYANFNLSYQDYKSDLIILPPPLNTRALNRAQHWLGEFTLQGTLSHWINVLLGGNHQQTEADASTPFSAENSSLYTQWQFKLSSHNQIIAGLQYNAPDSGGSHTSPRLGFIHQFNANWGSKLLFSSAFREPSGLDRFFESPVVVGDKNLKPETIDTWDAQLFYFSGADSFTITVFHSKQKDIITRQPGTPVRIINGGELRYRGIEVEGRYAPAADWLFTANTSYQTNADADNNNDVTYSPDWMLKAGIAHDFTAGASAGLFYHYFAAATLQNEEALYYNENPSGYHLLTLNFNANVGRWLLKPGLEHLSLSLYLDNLLDQEIYFPSMNRPAVNSIPHHAGRGAYLSLHIELP